MGDFQNLILNLNSPIDFDIASFPPSGRKDLRSVTQATNKGVKRYKVGKSLEKEIEKNKCFRRKEFHPITDCATVTDSPESQ